MIGWLIVTCVASCRAFCLLWPIVMDVVHRRRPPQLPPRDYCHEAVASPFVYSKLLCVYPLKYRYDNCQTIPHKLLLDRPTCPAKIVGYKSFGRNGRTTFFASGTCNGPRACRIARLPCWDHSQEGWWLLLWLLTLSMRKWLCWHPSFGTHYYSDCRAQQEGAMRCFCFAQTPL